MFTIEQYVKAESLAQAYALNQKKTSAVLGGCGWLKMGHRPIKTAIDLSGLGLDQIEEQDDHFSIGCMVTLRQLETSKALAACFGTCFADAVHHIVGVQFRGSATIGGSLWQRFGFSDPLTLLMALDAQISLHEGGTMPLAEFAARAVHRDYRDIITHVILPKRGQKTVYISHRATATDLPVLTVCAVSAEGAYRVAVGARPQRAALLTDDRGVLSSGIDIDSATAFADYAADGLSFGSNLRGSADFRRHLCRVLVKRALLAHLEV